MSERTAGIARLATVWDCMKKIDSDRRAPLGRLEVSLNKGGPGVLDEDASLAWLCG